MFDRLGKTGALESAQKAALSLLSERGEANARSTAGKLVDVFKLLGADDQLKFFEFLSAELSPAPTDVLKAAGAYAENPDAESLIRLVKTVEPRRQELLRRLNRAPDGTQTIVRMRELLLGHLKARPELRVLDADMQHLFGSWFNPGFLELYEITWSSPARLLEKIIQHESVHAIDGWDDLRRRLQPDRRCYAFLHPQLPGDPLIFVEVALVPHIATEVGPLLDKNSEPLDPKKFKTAIFYSISNCQPGLRGVSLGNFLIKRVAERILQEVPSVRTFCTLSPVPGFNRWLDTLATSLTPEILRDKRNRLGNAVNLLTPEGVSWSKRVMAGWKPATASAEEKTALLRLCHHYLSKHVHSAAGDSVARFHLANGAELHNINWNADLSKKGIAQSSSIMVNYLYQLDKIERNHQEFLKNVVVYSRRLDRLS